MVPGCLGRNSVACVGGPWVLYGGKRLAIGLAAGFLLTRLSWSLHRGTDSTEYLAGGGFCCVIIQVPFREHRCGEHRLESELLGSVIAWDSRQVP